MMMRGLWLLCCPLVVSGTQGDASMTTYVDYSRLAIQTPSTDPISKRTTTEEST